MLPNLVKLLGRLVKDPRVPRRSKLVLLAAVGYVLSPIDILPEMIPVAGILDDLFLVAFALNHLIERAGEEIVVEHWDGPQDILAMVRSALGTNCSGAISPSSGCCQRTRASTPARPPWTSTFGWKERLSCSFSIARRSSPVRVSRRTLLASDSAL